MKEFKIKATTVFKRNEAEYRTKKHRIIVNEGGTGSSKTVSLAQLFNEILIEEENCTLTIARKTFPALRATAMKDFFAVMKGLGVYREENHNKSENIYRYKSNELNFVSVDEPIKIRSRRRQYLWMNEANEFSLEDYRQLAMRTDKQIFMDYNPSHQFHWLYDEIHTRKDCVILRSTYLDNPFLPEELVKEVESYKDKDKNYWRIYGLGERGIAESIIYTHWQYCNKLPDNPDRRIFGLDFGYNNPTALIEVDEKDRNYFWDEKIYKSHLNNSQLIDEMKRIGITEEDEIQADSNEPARIDELRDAGFNIYPTEKGAGSVRAGIGFIKSHGLYITKRSVNIGAEIKSYSWQEKDGKPLDDPVKVKDHAMDAGRYGEYALREEEGEMLTIL